MLWMGILNKHRKLLLMIFNEQSKIDSRSRRNQKLKRKVHMVTKRVYPPPRFPESKVVFHYIHKFKYIHTYIIGPHLKIVRRMHDFHSEIKTMFTFRMFTTIINVSTYV